jgi:hypothetical protein
MQSNYNFTLSPQTDNCSFSIHLWCLFRTHPSRIHLQRNTLIQTSNRFPCTSPAKHPTHSPRSQQSFQKFWPITTMIFNPIFRFSSLSIQSLLIQTKEKSESKQKKKEEGLKRKKKTEATDAVWEAIDKRMNSRRKDRREARLKEEIEKLLKD